MPKAAKRTKAPAREAPPLSKRVKSNAAPRHFPPTPLYLFWVPILALAAVTFAVYWPSLKADFVYDGRVEILEEGFITSPSNLPAVLSLKVLGMNLMLADRPGQMLYLMLLASVCGKDPWGYHLCGNLLQVANVALLFLLLSRLIAFERTGQAGTNPWKLSLAAFVASLIFALHPMAVEPVSAINFSSDLLVTFFTLLALNAATRFRPENARSARLTGALGIFCCLASVTCKESGLATSLLLGVYWFLFRRKEEKKAWLPFLGAAITVTALFLAARFLFAPAGSIPPQYLGGSFWGAVATQPRLWVFMMGKLIWPTHLSADYTLENLSGLSAPVALVILFAVVAGQGWLAMKSRLGALGVAVFWLGLATVSNFIPLNRVMADRFYYLPLAGLAMQLTALFVMAHRSRWGFWLVLSPCVIALIPLTWLTLVREEVFAKDDSLWSDTAQASPRSDLAYNGVGLMFANQGRAEEAVKEYQVALDINPNFAKARGNLANALFKMGRVDEAIAQYQKALEIEPNHAETHNNFGNVLSSSGQLDEAIAQYQKSLAINSTNPDAHHNLGLVLIKKGRVDEAIAEYEKALDLDPNDLPAHNSLGLALLQKKRWDEAMIQFQETLNLQPSYAVGRNNLGIALFRKGQIHDAVAQFEEAVRLDPNYTEARNNLAKVKSLDSTAPSSP